MPLDKGSLTSGLKSIFENFPPDVVTAANKIASEYDRYCKGGVAAPGKPQFLGTEKTVLAGQLSVAFSSFSGPAAVASAFSVGIQAYWLAPPVVFVGGVVNGLATAMPGASAVIPVLMSAFLNLGNTPDTIANLIATALDAATRTVLVTFATPAPPAGPPPPATVL